MARYSTPATREYARDKAEIIGQAQRIICGEVWDWATRVMNYRATPAVAIVAFFGFIVLAHALVESINL